ncbi:hypothetical protein BDV95DRAFT_675445 [Massariosphaeria phaeospora]|uniref:tRNA-dihydrouridine(16/17) synthase [NAD(P)(+)] n=1 Tax=Massariosphaeria phaeospora TaxID=100035 RepID=A0A7C8I9E6_9PLEO|nr:hypothetical protein BDV95DRAFT_675445 [Massariosphaeria phaeospora]
MASEGSSEMQASTVEAAQSNGIAVQANKRVKLHGRAFYESIGSPKIVLAPMVEQSEFAWRLLSRSFLPPPARSSLLAYSPMFHSKMFGENPKYRDSHFQPLKTPIASPPDAYHTSQLSEADSYLDGHPEMDRPLTVQFCSNDPDEFLNAAKHVAPFCDAVDLNLGCPQGIARRGNYGAFLQEDWALVGKMIRKLHEELEVPVTAKMRVLETKEKTLEYAKVLLDAGASIITVHGRQREQKGHNTGLADWSTIRYLRENLPKGTVIFANGNILQHEDIAKCLEETGADAVMSAEGNLHDPTIFAEPPPVGEEGREYWRGRDGKGGYRVDAVFRRYMDIIYQCALGQPPPTRKPLFLPSDPEAPLEPEKQEEKEKEKDEQNQKQEQEGPPRKKQRRAQPHPETPQPKSDDKQQQKLKNPNLTPMQAHLFHMLRPLVAMHHNVRDALARCRVGDIDGFEKVLRLVEEAVKQGLIDAANEREHDCTTPATDDTTPAEDAPAALPTDPYTSSLAAVARCKRPWWVCQPYVRPLPKEAIEKGSMQLSKKEKKRLEAQEEEERKAGLVPGGRDENVEVPKEGVVCG